MKETRCLDGVSSIGLRNFEMFQFNYDILTTWSRRRVCGELRGQAQLVDHEAVCKDYGGCAVRRRSVGSTAIPRRDGQLIWPAERRDGQGDLEGFRVKCRLCLERHRQPRTREVHPVRDPAT